MPRPPRLQGDAPRPGSEGDSPASPSSAPASPSGLVSRLTRAVSLLARRAAGSPQRGDPSSPSSVCVISLTARAPPAFLSFTSFSPSSHPSP